MANLIVCARPNETTPTLAARQWALLDDWRCLDGSRMTDAQAEARHAVRVAMRKTGLAWQSADDAEQERLIRRVWALVEDPALRPSTRAAA